LELHIVRFVMLTVGANSTGCLVGSTPCFFATKHVALSLGLHLLADPHRLQDWFHVAARHAAELERAFLVAVVNNEHEAVPRAEPQRHAFLDLQTNQFVCIEARRSPEVARSIVPLSVPKLKQASCVSMEDKMEGFRRARITLMKISNNFKGRDASSGIVRTVPKMFDVDCNLNHDVWEAGHVQRILSNARRVGVTEMVVPGSDLRCSKKAQAISRKSPIEDIRIFFTAGTHPYNTGEEDFDLELLREIAQDGAVAIGECGLDFSEGFPSPSLQLPIFEAQVSLACELGLPLFLHERLAHEEFMAVLNCFKGKLPKLLVHCFTGTAQELDRYLDFGCYISVAGIVCRAESGKHLRETIRRIPLEKLMVETDSPYMGFPGCQREEAIDDPSSRRHLKAVHPNFPSALPRVIEVLADSLRLDPSELAKKTRENALSFFNID